MQPQQRKRFCTYCGKEVSKTAEVCFDCGCRVYGGKSYCHNCGVKLNPNQVICVKCRSSLEDEVKFEKNLNQVLAGVLALLLGGIGIHKFYLGHTLSGIIYLIFSWTGIPVFLGFIDGICLFCMSSESFNRKYNKQVPANTVCSPKQPLSNIQNQNISLGTWLLWIGVACVLLLVLGLVSDKEEKHPVIQSVNERNEKPPLTIPLLAGLKSDSNLSDLISCKKVNVTYFSNVGQISIMKPICFGNNKYPYQDANLRRTSRRSAKKVEYTKSAEIHFAVPDKKGTQVTVSNFIYGQKNYLGVVCIGRPNIENMCEAITRDVANKENLF